MTMSPCDFNKYRESGALGRLSFPNGNSRFGGGSFSISLADLYRLVFAESDGNPAVTPDEIIGIVAFGDSVEYPGFTETIKSAKKYRFFGPETRTVERVGIQPERADFVVIQEGRKMQDGRIVPDESYEKKPDSGAIRLSRRYADRIIGDSPEERSKAFFGMGNGVPVIYDDRLESLLDEAGMAFNNPRKVHWIEIAVPYSAPHCCHRKVIRGEIR